MHRTQLIKIVNRHGQRAEFQVAAEDGQAFSKVCHRLGFHVTDIIERPVTCDFVEALEAFAEDKGEDD